MPPAIAEVFERAAIVDQGVEAVEVDGLRSHLEHVAAIVEADTSEPNHAAPKALRRFET